MNTSQKFISILLSFIMALAPLGTPHQLGAFFSGGLSVEDRQNVLLDLRLTAAEARSKAMDLDRNYWNIAARSDQLGSNVEDIVEWVESQILWITYQGVLRGARGTLLEGRGNHLDRALLLAELLQSAGHEDVKLLPAHGYWPKDQLASALEQAMQIDQPDPPSRQADPSAFAASLRTKEIIERGQNVRSEVRRRAHHMEQPLAQSLWEASEHNGADDRESAAKAWSDYWTVQVNGEVIALGLPGVGTELARPEASGDPIAPDELPEEYFHTIQLFFHGIVWKDGDVETKQVFEHTLRSADLIGMPIYYGIASQSSGIPPTGQLLEFDAEELETDLREKMLAQREWYPVLSVGNDYFWDKAISDEGVLNDNPEESGVERGFRRASETLSGLSVRGRSRGPNAHLIGMEMTWLSQSPGLPEERQTRVIYDAFPGQDPQRMESVELSEEQRLHRAYAFTSQGHFLAFPGDMAKEYLDFLIHRDVANLYSSVADLLDAVDLQNNHALGRLLDDFDPGMLDLLSFSRTLQEMRASYESLYINRPIMIGKVQRYRSTAEDMYLQEIFDLTFAQYGSLHKDSRKAGKDRFRFGLVQTVLESVFAEGFQMGQASTFRWQNTAEAFAESLAGEEKWVVLKSEQDLERHSPAMDRQTGAAVQSALASGQWVYFDPGKESKDLLWWDFNPESGHLLGRYNEGWGAVSAEYKIVWATVSLAFGFSMKVYCTTNAIRGGSEEAILSCFARAMCGLVAGIIFALATYGTAGTAAPIAIYIPLACAVGESGISRQFRDP